MAVKRKRKLTPLPVSQVPQATLKNSVNLPHHLGLVPGSQVQLLPNLSLPPNRFSWVVLVHFCIVTLIDLDALVVQVQIVHLLSLIDGCNTSIETLNIMPPVYKPFWVDLVWDISWHIWGTKFRSIQHSAY